MNNNESSVSRELKNHVNELKSNNIESIEYDADIEKKMDQAVVNLNQQMFEGIDLLSEKALPNEQKIVNRIFSKDSAILKKEPDQMDDNELEDARVLVRIASRELEQGNVQNAEKIFPLLVKLFPMLGSTWAGLAACALEQGQIQKADIIYSYALECLPDSYFLLLQAAQFYLSQSRKEKAQEIIKKIQDVLSYEQNPTCISFISEELKQLQTHYV